MCVWGQETGFKDSKERGKAGTMHMGQSGHSMGLEWMKFAPMRPKLPPQVRFSHLKKITKPHILIYIYHALNKKLYIFPLQVKNATQLCNYSWYYYSVANIYSPRQY
jgi:hypothetical protein